MPSYKDGLGSLRTAPDCGHRAPLNWLGLPSSMICGHVGRSSGSTYGRSHYCPYWEPCHVPRPCSLTLKNESGTSFKQLQDARTSIYIALQLARAPFGTRKRVSGTRAIEACLQNKHPETGPACRSREDPLGSGSPAEVDAPIALLPSWEKGNGERESTCSGVSDLRGVTPPGEVRDRR